MFNSRGDRPPPRAAVDASRESGPRVRREWRDSLLVKHAAFVTLVFILTTGTLGHLAYRFARGMLSDDADERLMLVASGRALLLEKSAAEQLQDLALVAGRPRLAQLLGERAAGEARESLVHDEIAPLLESAK